MSRWLVTGAGGMLGRDLVSVLESRGAEVAALRRSDLDITDTAAVRAALRHWQPAVLVNCAAWTAVDDAEARETEALRVNGQAVTGLAAACAARGTVLVQPSTDYVFDGRAGQPYPEDSATSPRSAYGRSKLAGEHAVLDQPGLTGYVVRTAWLYGAFGKSFVGTMIGRARAQADVQVVDDQRGQPTWTVDVAAQIAAVVGAAAEPGIYHATSSADTTWFGLAQQVYRLLGADPSQVRPIRSTEFGAAAPRPAYSVLGHAAWAQAGIPAIGDWRDALRRALPCLLCASGVL